MATLAAHSIWVCAANYAPHLIGSAFGRRVPAPPPGVPRALSWAGVRGVVSMAIALALPLHLPGRDLIIVVTFSVIMVTLLVQGTTLERLLSTGGLGASPASGRSEPAQSSGVRASPRSESTVLGHSRVRTAKCSIASSQQAFSRTRREPARG